MPRVVAGYTRNLPDSSAIAGATVTIRDRLGNVVPGGTTNPVTSDAQGFFRWETDLSPGPIDVVATFSGTDKRIRSGLEVMQMGELFASDFIQYFRVFSNGVIRGRLSDFLVTASTTARELTVGQGVGIVDGRIIALDRSTRTLFPDANPDLASRRDIVVLRQHTAGLDAGKQELLLVKGTLNDTDPATNNVANTRDLLIARATTAQNATVSTVTMIRTYAIIVHNHDGVYSPVGHNHDGVYSPATHNHDSTYSLIAHNHDTVYNRRFLIGQSIGDGAAPNAFMTNPDTITFEDAPFLVTHPVAGRTHFAPIFGTAAGTFAEGNHTHGTGNRSRFNDTNFTAKGVLSTGAVTLGTASVTLPAGSWLIESFINVTLRGTGSSGVARVHLEGNGTPQGTSQSSRFFQHVGGVPRQVVLSGRWFVAPTASTVFDAAGIVTYDSGDAVDVRDGVVYMTATPRN